MSRNVLYVNLDLSVLKQAILKYLQETLKPQLFCLTFAITERVKEG